MSHRQDEWLEQLLSAPAQLKPDEFSSRVERRIRRYRHQRRRILSTVWLSSLIVAAIFMPWNTLRTWLTTAADSGRAWLAQLEVNIVHSPELTISGEHATILATLGCGLLLITVLSLQEED